MGPKPQATETTSSTPLDLEATERELLARLAEIQGQREAVEADFATLLAEAAAKHLPHPAKHGLSATDEDPKVYAVIFKGDGVVEIVNNAKKFTTTAKRQGTSKTRASDYNLEPMDVVFREVGTDAMSRHSGLPKDALIEMTVIDDTTFASKNPEGVFLKGTLSATFRHAMKHEQEANGVMHWLKHSTSRVRRGGKVLRLDESGRVIA